MKSKLHQAVMLVSLTMVLPAAADVIYSNLLDTPIPLEFQPGLDITVDGGTINAFFGGVGVANDANIQPFRVGTGGLDTILNWSIGDTLDGGSTFLSSLAGGSQDHLGNTFTSGQEGNIGFKTSNGNYGWMRVVLTNNTAGAVVKDWAYEDSGAAMVVGRVNQSTAVLGAQTVTFSPGIGESFTLGSLTSDAGGNVNSVVKSGVGTTTLTAANTYTGTTNIDEGTLMINGDASAATGAVTVANAATLGGNGTIGAAVNVSTGGFISAGANANAVGNLTINNGLTVTGTYLWDLGTLSTANAGIDFDVITISAGDVDIAGADLGLNLGANAPSADPFWQTDQTWGSILNNTGSGTLTGAFAAIDNTAWVTFGTFSTNTIGNDVNLVWTAVPEPRAALLAALGLFALLRRRRA